MNHSDLTPGMARYLSRARRAPRIVSEATAYRAFYGEGAAERNHLYEVHFDGRRLDGCYVRATDLPQARGLVRKALRAAFESRWNQALIFDGTLAEGEVAEAQFRTYLRRLEK